jgi:hypothetical protein
MNNVSMPKGILNEKYVFLSLLTVGISSSYFLYPYAKGYPYQFGPQMIGLFVPPFLTGLYLFYFFYLNELNKIVLVKAVLLFFLQLLPFYPLFFLEVSPFPGEDFARNFAYAQNMIRNQTLWGGDKIAYPDEGYAFITQPGYRYFITLEMLLFKKLYRIVSVINILFFIVALFFFLKSVTESFFNSRFKLLLAVFLVLTIPYATKNILMGLSEWFMVSILMLSVYFFKVCKWSLLSVVLLALVPFIRQNTLPSVLLLAGWIVFNSKQKILLILSFLIVLLLPLYHNLYYAGEWRFFVSIYHWPFLSYESSLKDSESSGVNYMLIISNLLHYLGIHIRGDGSIDFLEEAFAFLLPFLFICFFVQKYFFSGYLRLLFLMITLGIIGPTVFFATDFYPRFEFVCVFLTLSAFTFLIKNSTPIHSKGLS